MRATNSCLRMWFLAERLSHKSLCLLFAAISESVPEGGPLQVPIRFVGRSCRSSTLKTLFCKQAVLLCGFK
jgi:hypothetical protein